MMKQLFEKEATPLPADEIITILGSDSAELDRYLGEAIYIKTDPHYLAAQKRRFLETVTVHRERVGNRPTYLLRAPGRLNAFLEYLDMCDGDHMSTTIDGDIPVAISPREDDLLNLGNVHRLFPPSTCRSARNSPGLRVRPGMPPPGWRIIGTIARCSFRILAASRDTG